MSGQNCIAYNHVLYIERHKRRKLNVRTLLKGRWKVSLLDFISAIM